jgi:DNA-binding MurR/RpiR family transcriptional regulator
LKRDDTYHQLEVNEIAHKIGVSDSDVIRMAVKEFVRKEKKKV